MTNKDFAPVVVYFAERDGKIRLRRTRKIAETSDFSLATELKEHTPENTRYIYFTIAIAKNGKFPENLNDCIRAHNRHFHCVLREIDFMEADPKISFFTTSRKNGENGIYNVAEDLLHGNLSATIMECLFPYEKFLLALSSIGDKFKGFKALEHMAILYACGGSYYYHRTLRHPLLDWTSHITESPGLLIEELALFREFLHTLPHDGMSNYDFEMNAQSLDYRFLRTIMRKLPDKMFNAFHTQFLCRHFPADLLFCAFWNERKRDIGNLLFKPHKITPKPIKNIAIFCGCIGHGGAEQCAVILANHFVELGYHVFFYTNEKPQEGDYPYSSRIERRILPLRPHERRVELRIQLTEDEIDTCIFIDHAVWREKMDILTAYEMNLRTVAMEHSVFTYPLHQGEPLGMDERCAAYFAADAVTLLSHADCAYWHSLAFKNVLYMPNPPTFDPEKIQESEAKTSHTLIFVGRLTKDKGVFDALNVVLRLKEDFPDVKLILCGRDGDSEEEKQELAQFVKKFKLADNLLFTGFIAKDELLKYYRQAAIHLMPSNFEGYPMTMLEAKAHGIPTVMYELPYVEIAKKGCVQTFGNEPHLLATEIAKLFKDPEKLQQLGAEAKESLQEVSAEIVFDRWAKLFRYLETGEDSDKLFSEERTQEELLEDQRIAMLELQGAYDDLQKNKTYLLKNYRRYTRVFLHDNPVMNALDAVLDKWPWLERTCNRFFGKLYEKRRKKIEADPYLQNGNHGFPPYDDE